MLSSLCPATDLRLRSSEDVRAALCEAQEAAVPEIQEQIHDYRYPARPSCALPASSPLFFPLVCVCAHLTPCPVLNVGIHLFLSVCLAQNKAYPGAGQPVR